jgi:hypothetical protein
MDFIFSLFTDYGFGGLVSMIVLIIVFGVIGLSGGFSFLVTNRLGWIVPTLALVVATTIWYFGGDFFAGLAVLVVEAMAFLLCASAHEIHYRLDRRNDGLNKPVPHTSFEP